VRLSHAVLAAAAAIIVLVGCGKPPLVPDVPKGPAMAQAGIVLACTTKTTDPSGADVSYQFDWGDGSQSDWSPFIAGGVAFADTHTYANPATYKVRARARNAKRASAWSAALDLAVNPGEGGVRWRIAYTDPDDPEDSVDFSLNTFAVDEARDAVYIGCEYGAVICRRLNGVRRWEFLNRDADAFLPAPAIGSDGTVYIGCSNDSLYALNPDGTRRWAAWVGDEVAAPVALGTAGVLYCQTAGDSLLALNSTDGSRIWSRVSGGGNSAPVVGTDGSVYVGGIDGLVEGLDPSNGSPKWSYYLGSGQIDASPAIDPAAGVLYVANADGYVAALGLADGNEQWKVPLGEGCATPVVGADGRVIISAGGKVQELNKASGAVVWQYAPLSGGGLVSSPALSSDGSIYVLATLGKRLDNPDPDSLYCVAADGTRRWATALGEGLSDDVISAPKIDSEGNVYIGSGFCGWCVLGTSEAAQTAWPQFQRDALNTGRAQ